MAASNTVIALKTTFLRTQIRILSQPLQPAQSERGGTNATAALSDSAIRDAIREVNRVIRRHNKAVYSSLAIRHVAEQIDKLYWDAGAPDLQLESSGVQDAGSTTTPLKHMDDLSLEENIARFPENWEEHDDQDVDEQDREAYLAVLERLQELSFRRAGARAKLARYRQLQSLLLPFKNPQNSIQPNLVTRDAALVAELARCRALGIRVGSRVAAIEGKKLDDTSTGNIYGHESSTGPEGHDLEEGMVMIDGAGSLDKLRNILETQ